jgi:hypothetical protein
MDSPSLAVSNHLKSEVWILHHFSVSLQNAVLQQMTPCIVRV